ncbi:Alpha/Beta hydrolase protein [Aspergillus pseudoustus]|uniref:Alpha/Beta hydrolase protein n=1 Tax=Aspergillus pseudoustus TaxID=1810923 RepID=A0ABR4IR04_9EURO
MAIDPANIILGGESAGGYLALTLLDRLSSDPYPGPGGAVLIAPWIDLLNWGGSFARNKHLDLLNKPGLDKFAQQVTGNRLTDKTLQVVDPSINIMESRSFLPPVTWVTVGSHDLFVDDVVRFVEKAKKAGSTITLEVMDGLPHVWQQVDLFQLKDYYRL